MIYFICRARHRYTIKKFLAVLPPNKQRLLTVLSYEELFTTCSIPPANLIFTDFDRLSQYELETAAVAAEAMRSAWPEARILNHPARFLQRHDLLERLWHEGINPFRSARLELPLPELSFPVFLRREGDSAGPESGLLPDREALDSAIAEIRSRGIPLRGRLAVEFCGRPDAAGLFRKFGAFRVIDQIVPQHIQVSDNWMVKKSSQHVTEAHAEEEIEYIRTNPHQDALMRIMDIAGADFGRIDYTVMDGRIVVFEINSNPSFPGADRDDPRQERRRIVRDGMVAAFTRMDAPAMGDTPVRFKPPEPRSHDLPQPQTKKSDHDSETLKLRGQGNRLWLRRSEGGPARLNAGWNLDQGSEPTDLATAMQIFDAAFDEIADPHAENARHELGELLVVAFVSVLCGATTCAEMAAFGQSKEGVFKGFLKLKHGVPSPETFSAVFRMIAPEALDAAFGRVLADVTALLREGDAGAIDGAALNGAPLGTGKNERTRMMVSAYAERLRLTLASVPEGQGAEHEAALDGLGLIALKGTVVSADARHCNHRTVAAINAQGGDWCLALNTNQGALLSVARASFGKLKGNHPAASFEETGYGRKETRTAVVVSAMGVPEHHELPGLKGFGRILATREADVAATSDLGFFALSWLPSPEVLLATARAHWAIDTAPHWQFDVSLREGAARNQKDNGPGNIAVLRRHALDVVRRDTSEGSLSIKLKRAGWDDAFLCRILSGLAEA